MSPFPEGGWTCKNCGKRNTWEYAECAACGAWLNAYTQAGADRVLDDQQSTGTSHQSRTRLRDARHCFNAHRSLDVAARLCTQVRPPTPARKGNANPAARCSAGGRGSSNNLQQGREAVYLSSLISCMSSVRIRPLLPIYCAHCYRQYPCDCAPIILNRSASGEASRISPCLDGFDSRTVRPLCGRWCSGRTGSLTSCQLGFWAAQHGYKATIESKPPPISAATDAACVASSAAGGAV